ncbi:heme biosynthesis protein HemY [Ancylobacter pratisalsi]|uniref:Heme biosynthesis protein HemY n=1 Tax=Ancylobacter pratisalsi TaxID=1745854 RepID=A0A6P1YKP5_9HYPH|nr:heme biosynthesis HemY N-terminal domain-containing protein [Ancylobacter pratisalsi]QIB33261.1 heme biosynthesis protein HemY [Ancylobacter pratisalsi]
MIRLVVYLLILASIAFGVSWLADRPGTIAMEWQGWHVETSVLVAASGLLVLVAGAILLWSLLRLIVRSPDLIAGSYRHRRRNKGWAAISRGLVAVGSGDTLGARRAANDAQRLLGQEPLTQLLSAQAAQLSGDASGAEATFRAMTETPATRMLGLRGLHVEARRRGDSNAALMAAEEAARYEPGLAWAADAVIEARCHAGDFAGALAVLEREAAHGGLDRAAHRRRRAVLLAAQAQALELGDPAVAREKAVEATRLAPSLVPAAEVAGRLLGASGDTRKAAKVLETAYASTPHPDLADAYLHLRPGDSSRERLKRMRTLTSRMPAHSESAMALARAALDAQEFDVARTSLSPLLVEPTQRVCLLMAELEASENSDVGKAREWTARAVRARRDPAWVADGVVAEHWGPVSPVTGKLDAFEWKLPPGVASTPMLENEADRVKAAIAAALESRANHDEAPLAPVTAPEPELDPPAATAPVAVPEPAPVEPPVKPADAARPVAGARPAEPAAAVRTVVAMPPVPDDPGPDPFPDEDPREARPPYGV